MASTSSKDASDQLAMEMPETLMNGGSPSAVKSELVETFLNLEKLDKNLYRSRHQMVGLKGRSAVYGGQVIGQALVAALKTVDSTFHPHSLHCYFIKAGNENMPILYQVDRVRDGRSFGTRFVKAIQDGNAIFTAELSFHKEEADSISHQWSMPNVPKPDELATAREVIEEAMSRTDLTTAQRSNVEFRSRNLPEMFELKPVNPRVFLRLEPDEAKAYCWVKAVGTIGEDYRLQHCAAAFFSDSNMVGTALQPHLARGFVPSMVFSLDHSIWIHRYKFRIDDWMLYETESPIADFGVKMGRWSCPLHKRD